MESLIQRYHAKIAENLSVFYFIVAAIAVTWSAVVVPPFRVPDEAAHIYRAEQVSVGQVTGERKEHLVGGHVDGGLFRFVETANREVQAGWSVEQSASASSLSWQGDRVFGWFPNTIRSTPVTYLPQAMGLWLGRLIHLSIFDSFTLARLFNGWCAVAVCAWAIQKTKRGRVLMTTLLLLPMAIFLMGSASQDALIIALSALLAAVMTRSSPTKVDYHLAVLCVLTLAMARYPLVALGGILLFPRWKTVTGLSATRRASALLACAALFIVWFAFNMQFQVPMRGEVPESAGPQVAFIMQNPIQFLRILWSTIYRDWWMWQQEFIGQLGWLNVTLPKFVHRCCKLAILAGAAICIGERDDRKGGVDKLATFATATVTGLLMIVATYLTWTPVGLDHVEGTQGRYFYSVVLFLPAVLPTLRLPRAQLSAVSLAAICLCLVCSVQALVRTERVVRHHYSVDAQGNQMRAWRGDNALRTALSRRLP